MSSYTEKGFDGKTLPYSTDARLWAKEFVKISSINLSTVFDEHEMTRWFDGAIQAGIEDVDNWIHRQAIESGSNGPPYRSEQLKMTLAEARACEMKPKGNDV